MLWHCTIIQCHFQEAIAEVGDNWLMVVKVSWKVHGLMACISYITYRRGQRKRRYLFNLEYMCGILHVKRKNKNC